MQLVLSQRRFTYLGDDSSQTWLIPVNLRVFSAQGEDRRIDVLMEAPEIRIDLGSDAGAYKLNDGQTGYYRVKYADAFQSSAAGRPGTEKGLPPEDRWGFKAICMPWLSPARRTWMIISPSSITTGTKTTIFRWSASPPIWGICTALPAPGRPPGFAASRRSVAGDGAWPHRS